MAMRLAAQKAPASLVRRAILQPRSATTSTISTSRFYSDKPSPSPSAKASSILDALPGNSLISKTGWVTLGTGLSAMAISKELYVANEETVILVGFLIFATIVGKAVVGPYKEWADGQIQKISGILNSSRQEHTKAVQSRIDSVEQQKDVVEMTKGLFAIAKQTAEMERSAFELSQRTTLAAEVKSVLDSWVRYEGAEREEQQRALSASVIQSVMKSLQEERTQKSILEDAVSEIEKLVKSKAI